MKILITGGSGYLGAALTERFRTNREHTVVSTFLHNRFEGGVPLDITKRSEVQNFFLANDFDYIIHTAAKVKGCEENPLEAWTVNVHGMQNLVRAAKRKNIPFINTSSAGVYAAEEGLYEPKDPKDPEGVYSETKAAQEDVLIGSGLEKYVNLRLSWLFGYSPRIEEKWLGEALSSIAQGKPIEADNEWHFSPSWIPHVFQVIEWWMQHPEGVHVLHAAAEGVTTKYQLLQEFSTLHGLFPSELVKEKGIKHLTMRRSVEGGALREVKAKVPRNLLDVSQLKELGAPYCTVAEAIEGGAVELMNYFSGLGTFPSQ